MKYLKTHSEDHIYHILLDRGRSNAMDIDLIDELLSAIDTAQSDPAIEGLVLSGKEGFFSAGLDLISLYDYDETQMKLFWTQFMTLIQRLASFSKPAVAAITGHNPAGGCVLALCCDYRIMADGDYIIGLNEIPVGLVVPDSIFKLYSFWLGTGTAYRSLMEGKLFTPREALSAGLVDEVVELNRIQNAALRKIKGVTQFEQNAWRTSKQNFRKSLIADLQFNQQESIDQVLAQWWKPGTRSILKTIIDNLTQKKG